MIIENDKLMNKQSKIMKKNSKGNLCSYNKVNPKSDYIVAGPNKEADRATSAKTAVQIHN